MKLVPSLEQLMLQKGQGFSYLPIGVEIPSDTLTPVSAFLRLRQSGCERAFLLESADGGEAVGRYSFLGIDPFAKLVSENSKLTFVDRRSNTTKTSELTFENIEAFISRYSSPKIEGYPPFIGGAVGHIGYDAVRFIESLPSLPNDLGTADIHLSFYSDVIAFDRLKHRLYLITHIDSANLSEQARADAEKKLQDLKARLFQRADDELLPVSPSDFSEASPVAAESRMGREKFCAAVAEVKEHIREGDIFQAVLSDRFHFPYESDPFYCYRILRMINPSPYLFYLLDDDQVLLGASPEMLIRTSDGYIETCPIAGTKPRGHDKESDLLYEQEMLASEKERAEHLMLVDLGRNDIGRVSQPTTVEVKQFMKVERYSHVMHLVSLVGGRLSEDVSPMGALASCFPAGTLSGAPKIRAMEIIAEKEQTARGPYGGAIVCHDFSGALNSCITIRTMLVKDGVAYVQAGAGIVADSDPDKEYDEVLNKSKAIRTAAAIAAQLTGKQNASARSK